MKRKSNVIPKNIGTYEIDHVESELYKYAVNLGIINKSFNKENFKKKFFYLFIERNHGFVKKHGFVENLYAIEEKDKSESENFPDSMKRAFLYIFHSLSSDRKKKVDLEFLDNLYFLTKNSIRDTNSRQMRGYEMCIMSNVKPDDLSKKSLEIIFKMGNNYEAGINYELLPKQKAGVYVIKFINNYLEIILNHKMLREQEVKETMVQLLDKYYGKLSSSNYLSNDDKIKLIGALVSDIMKLHPYYNGNGRTFCFGLLNHLLIQEELTPCMIFNPWHICHANSEDRFLAIKEGQLAFRKYFIKGEKLNYTSGQSITSLSKKVDKMKTSMSSALEMFKEISVPVLNDEICDEISRLLFWYIQIKTFDACNMDSSNIRTKMSDKIEDLKSNGQLDIMKKLGSTRIIFNEHSSPGVMLSFYGNAENENFDFGRNNNLKVESNNSEFAAEYKKQYRSLINKFMSFVDFKYADFNFDGMARFIENNCAALLDKPKTNISQSVVLKLDQENKNVSRI